MYYSLAFEGMDIDGRCARWLLLVLFFRIDGREGYKYMRTTFTSSELNPLII